MRANLSIKQRIVLGFTLMIALVLLASGTGLLHTMSVQRTITVMSNGSRLTEGITNLQISWLAVVATVDNMLLTRQKSLIERQLNGELAEFQQQLNTLQRYSWKDNPQTSVQNQRYVENLKDLGLELKNVTDELATLALHGRWARAQYLRHNDLASLQSRMVENMDNLSMNARRDVETSVVESVNAENRIRTYWFVITLAAIGLGFLAGLLMIKSIIRPIAKLVYTARAVRDGDLSGTAEVLRDDEIGVLSNVFNSMTARLRDLIGSLEQEIEDHIQAENERSRLENELLQAQKMEAIGSLAGGVAHDFNNLLTAILGNAELALSSLRRDEGSNQKIIHEIQEIQHAAERASALTRQLLMFSRKEAIKSQVLDLNSTITGMQNMLRRLIPENIQIEYSCQRYISPVSADARQIEQVIMNLVVNARDAMPKGGRLEISTISTILDDAYVAAHAEARKGRHTVLIISDTGQGMDELTLARIFEPFFTTKERGRGTGLGLSCVYGIVKQAGGHITVSSKPGKGSRFMVYLPAVSGDAATAQPPDLEMPVSGGSETILLCEDDEIVRRLSTNILTSSGYRVIDGSNGKEALNLARNYNGHIDLLLTDVIMPGMNGRTLSERVKKEFPDIKILFMSGYTDTYIQKNGMLDANVELITKPFTRTDLLRNVRRVIEKT